MNGEIVYTDGIYHISGIILKENIAPLENAVEKVSAINGIYFNNVGKPENREVAVLSRM